MFIQTHRNVFIKGNKPLIHTSDCAGVRRYMCSQPGRNTRRKHNVEYSCITGGKQRKFFMKRYKNLRVELSIINSMGIRNLYAKNILFGNMTPRGIIFRRFPAVGNAVLVPISRFCIEYYEYITGRGIRGHLFFSTSVLSISRFYKKKEQPKRYQGFPASHNFRHHQIPFDVGCLSYLMPFCIQSILPAEKKHGVSPVPTFHLQVDPGE